MVRTADAANSSSGAPPLQVVLGASGGAGNAIVRAFAADGYRVRAVNRGGRVDLAGAANAHLVETVAADVTDPAQVAHAVAGAATVTLAAQPAYHRWAEEFPPMLEAVLAATADAGAKLVMVDNLYAYGSVDGPMTEDAPQAATDTKGRVRAAMADRLLRAHRTGELTVTIGRASDYFGPGGGNSAVSALAVQPAVRDRGALRWTASLDQPHSLAYLPDIARAYVVLATDPRADGRVWHLPHPRPVTGRQFCDLVNDQLTTPRKVGVISPLMLRLAAPFHRISRETLGILHQWDRPFVVDDSAFHATFGPFATTSLPVAVAETVAEVRGRRAEGRGAHAVRDGAPGPA